MNLLSVIIYTDVGRSTMGELSFEFNKEKAIETILYLANRIPKPTKHNITHIVYFADKTSLERYGRFISGDAYYALPHGPVPSETLNIINEPSTEQYGFTVKGSSFIPLREPELDYFSESDIESMDQVLEIYAHSPFWKIKHDSHDEAYEEAWESRGRARSKLMKLESIVGMLENSDELLEHLTRGNSE
jgi:uncharacterized phage-associated protein